MEIFASIFPILINVLISIFGIFLSKKITFIGKLASKNTTLVLFVLLILILFFQSKNIFVVFGMVLAPIMGSLIAVFLMNKFKFSQAILWPALFFSLLFSFLMVVSAIS